MLLIENLEVLLEALGQGLECMAFVHVRDNEPDLFFSVMVLSRLGVGQFQSLITSVRALQRITNLNSVTS